MAEKPLIAGHLMGLFTAISFGSAYPVAKPIVGVVDPFVFSAARYLVAGTILMLGVAIFAGGKFLPPRRDLVRLTIAGFLGFAVFQGLWGVALDLTTASKAAVLVSTTPIFGALIQAAEGQRLPAPAWAGIAVAFAGVFCVINNSFTTLNVAGGSLLGDAMFVGIAGVWALYGALSRPVIARIGAVRTAAWSALLGSLFLLPLAVPGLVRQEWGNVDPSLAVNFCSRCPHHRLPWHVDMERRFETFGLGPDDCLVIPYTCIRDAARKHTFGRASYNPADCGCAAGSAWRILDAKITGI